MQQLLSAFKGKKVFLTGHTGFKGAWLLQILHLLGAQVKGYALAPESTHDLYSQINGDTLCYASVIGDIRNAALLQGEMIRFEPDFVFHLAAQPLVRRSYNEPVYTFDVNVMGTLHVLEALRHLQKPCVALMITTDKVYENNETGIAFKEEDKLGGHDPYSASKAAAEIVISSYMQSYFPPEKFQEHQKSIAALRAGNVIGGGDDAADRIIPDIVRAIEAGEAVKIRNPKAIRPWQHVLEPLCCYLELAQLLHKHPGQYEGAYNIGPDKNDMLEVLEVTEHFIRCFGKGKYEIEHQPHAPHEAGQLMLDNTKISRTLGRTPRWTAQQAIQKTAEWYADKTTPALEKCKQQILSFY